jgi:hypothetical protein
MERNLLSASLISAALSVSIVIAWMAILLPSHAAPVVGPVGRDIVSPINSNSARKGDRVDVNLNHGTNSMQVPAVRSDAKIPVPVGCEGAFSKLVGTGNIAVRCITGIETSMKLAQALDTYRAL